MIRLSTYPNLCLWGNGSNSFCQSLPSISLRFLTLALKRSVPNNARAEKTSEFFSKQPHLAGSPQDFKDSKSMLELFQTEFGISPTSEDPIYPAGSEKSRHSTLRLTSPLGGSKPSAWIDVYYPVLDTPLDRTLDILGQDGQTIWSADLTEDGDPLDEDAAKYRDFIPAWHGLSGHGTAEGQVVDVPHTFKRDLLIPS